MTISYLSSLHHDGSKRYVQSPGADLHLGDEISIRLRSGTDAPIERVLLRTCPDGEQFFAEMQIEETSSACNWWQAKLRLTMPLTSYRFLIFTSDGIWWYNGTGPHRHVPTDAEDFRLLADYAAPAWVNDSVFYQIFPDRFADGDPASNVRDGEFEYQGIKSRARKWGETQSSWPEAMVEFYGGDLPGIEQRLDYLTDLGVNAIYLNPIFTAFSNHRYDVVDYFNIDPHLGGNAALTSLRQAATERGMRFILDIVPNHAGVEHPWFKSAVQNPDSPSAEYFTFHNHPDEYESWLGVRSLPKLNYRSQNLRDEIYAGPNSIFRYWLKPPFAADGWRVDVANMLARHGKDQLEAEVWAGIRQAVKEENPSAYLLGENFFDSSSQLQGDHLDASMNYFGFSNPIGFWLNHFEVNQHAEPRNVRSAIPWPTQALVDSWQVSRAAIPWQIARQQFNLLGSHDTPRIVNILNHDHALNRLAVAFLLTYVGVPCIYYGDEIGMSGKDALEARNCMVWDSTQWDSDLRAFYQTLIKLRRTSPALIDGGLQVLLVEENLLAYLRDTDEERIIVVGNRGPDEVSAKLLPVNLGAVPNGMIFRELFSGQTSTVVNGNLPLPSFAAGVQIWQA
ncbi:MAG: maltodextrin glucosidase [Chloroflexi bacterium]|nr:maltodextrin glucosidase [Chloroflexota bacterium]